MILAIGAVTALAAPASAAAWTVTVHVHGAGKVDELTNRNLMDCTTPSAVSESTVTDCVAGTANGLYSSGDIINLQAQVPQVLFDRGWRFLKWVDSKAGGGQINCDPQDQGGEHLDDNCQFQIFENLQTNLYFDDTFGPNATSVSGGPSSQTNSTSAAFTFDASDDPDALYDCRLDPPGPATGSFVACGSPLDKSQSYSDLTANGQYTFYVRGRDPSGNVDASPASHSWTVDTVAPQVTISGSPAHNAVTQSTTADLTGSTNEGTPSCTIDALSTPCAGPISGLADGQHAFQVTATDAAGNTGSASRVWHVDTDPPNSTITDGPSGPTFDRTPTFEFDNDEALAGSRFKCSLDRAPFEACESPHTTARLAFGRHDFRVRSIDASGNKESSASAATAVFKVVR